MSILELADVSVTLGGRQVLHSVDLQVDAGELVGLIGPNGAGKTTLLRSVLGVIPVSGGTVRVGGRPTRPGRVPIGYVPQRHEFAWDFPISVEQVVMSGLVGSLRWGRRAGVRHWRAVAGALERVRMSDLRRRPVGDLSGGQRQRVLVARALVLEPVALLLDEPFTGLDLPTQEVLFDLFGSLTRESKAVLMSTHDIPAALHHCDRVALLNRTITACARPDELHGPAKWIETFGISSDSFLLKTVQAV